jgi:hypothetical protein
VAVALDQAARRPGALDIAVHATDADLARLDRPRPRCSGDGHRARPDRLGWAPTHTASATLLEVLDGLSDGAGGATPPLHRHTGGRLRWRELQSGIGSRP